MNLLIKRTIFYDCKEKNFSFLMIKFFNLKNTFTNNKICCLPFAKYHIIHAKPVLYMSTRLLPNRSGENPMTN